MTNCPCGSSRGYTDCCKPLHAGTITAQSPEQLMRSRYCAFVKGETAYIYLTHSPSTRDNISVDSIEQWNAQCHWCGLHIVTCTADESANRVEFIAWYKEDNQLKYHHELSQFKLEPLDSEFQTRLNQIAPEQTNLPAQVWYYYDASYPDKSIALPKRNDPCICHSGKKYKKCCALSN